MEYLVFVEAGNLGFMGCFDIESKNEVKNVLTVKAFIEKIKCLTGRSAEIVGIEQRNERMEFLEQAELFWFVRCAPKGNGMTMISPELMA